MHFQKDQLTLYKLDMLFFSCVWLTCWPKELCPQTYFPSEPNQLFLHPYSRELEMFCCVFLFYHYTFINYKGILYYFLCSLTTTIIHNLPILTTIACDCLLPVQHRRSIYSLNTQVQTQTNKTLKLNNPQKEIRSGNSHHISTFKFLGGKRNFQVFIPLSLVQSL